MNNKSASSSERRTPLVGRTAELKLLRQLLAVSEGGTQLKAGLSKQTSAIPLDTLRSPQCMVLMGETGIGKTRLAEEVSQEAKERGWVVLWSRSYAQESNIPYRLWIEVLRSVIDADLWLAQDVHKHPLATARLATILPELYSQLPHVASTRQSPEQEQQSLWEAILTLFTTASTHQPMLVVLDDIQWADTSSCELLAYLARRSVDLPLVFLATCRDIELPPKHPLRQLLAHMQREYSVKTLPIRPLSNTQISTLVGHLPAETVQYIQTQSAGNPFFAEELAHSLSNSPYIATSDTQPSGHKKHASLPATIAAALHLRIDKLSQECQQLLSNAAVLGGSFEFSLISSLEATNTPTTDEDTVLDLLEEALRAGVLTEEGRGIRISYRFWHPLLVSHLYEGLSATRRSYLHRRIANILRQVYATREAEGAATIVYHLLEGGAEPEHIIHHATLAGNYAYALSAYPEAERQYRVAIKNARMIWSATQATLDERIRLTSLLEYLGECLRIQGNAEEARHIYEQALRERTARTQGDPHGNNSHNAYEAQVDALLWSEVGWTSYATNDYAHARSYCEQGKQVLREAGIVGGPAWARLYFQQSYIFWQEGQYDEARRAGAEALELFEAHLHTHPITSEEITSPTRLRRTLAGDPVDLARTHRLLGSLAYSTGQPTAALTHLQQALVLLEQYNHQREIAHVCCNMGHIYMQKAENTVAQKLLHRSLTLAEHIGDNPLRAVIFSNLGELAARSGNLAEAEDWYRRSLELAELIDDHVYVSTWNVELASVLQDQGRLPEAGTCIRRALTLGRAMHNTPCTGLALVALGNMRILQAREQLRLAKEIQDTQETYNQLEQAIRRSLERTRRKLQRALALQGLEAETQVKGHLALASIALLFGELETAQRQATETLIEARRHESMLLIARSQRLLGTILAASGQLSEAVSSFQEAIQLCQHHEMRLEYARTLQSYGKALLPTNPTQARHHLLVAQQLYSETQALIGLHDIDSLLSTLTEGRPE